MDTAGREDTRAYRPLLFDSIRLLHINSDVLSPEPGWLEEVRLNEAPPYYSISHCWGNQNQNTAIQISNHTLHVAPDLAVGIQRLQELAAKDSEIHPPTEYIWIDKICINQKDTQELSSQVHLMGRIYSQAVRTLIWLGPESPMCKEGQCREPPHLIHLGVHQV
ncbi:heterokaryon incompatibility protein-domain-containing protein [Hypoxylon fuscum]|nr:heterokaryon incompatibility protein-domain-containing protein [Hypoxylon fuscum]